MTPYKYRQLAGEHFQTARTEAEDATNRDLPEAEENTALRAADLHIRLAHLALALAESTSAAIASSEATAD